jgi:hypothetical protein
MPRVTTDTGVLFIRLEKMFCIRGVRGMAGQAFETPPLIQNQVGLQFMAWFHFIAVTVIFQIVLMANQADFTSRF